MAITLRQTPPAVGTDDGSSATVSVTTNSSPQVGDLAVVIHGNDFYTLATMPTPTATGSPTLTPITNGTADGGTDLAHIKSYTYTVNTAGAQTVSVTETGAHGEEKCLIVYVLAGANTTTPVDNAANATGNSTDQAAAAAVPTSSDAFVIIANNSGGGASTASYTSPGDVTEQYEIHVGGISGVGATKQLSVSGSTGTFTFSGAGSVPWGAVTIAINTASATAPGGPSVVIPPELFYQLLSWWTQQASSPASTDVTANAQAATGTGIANDASASVAPNAGNASGTGTANNASDAVSSNAGSASGTGTANSPTSSVAPNASAATGTGTANSPTAAVSPSAGAATGTGTANTASAASSPNATAATGTGTASNPTAAVSASAGNASGTGAAFDATVTISVNAGSASGAGTANNPAGSVAPSASAATGTGTANTASTALAPNAGAATGTGTANAPTAAVSPSTGAATGTGTANTPSVAIAANAGGATGTGQAFDATATTQPVVNANAAPALATGTAYDATVTITPNVGAATGTGTANTPTIRVTATASAAAGTGTAYNATVTTQFRTLVVDLGAPQPKWLFGVIQDTWVFDAPRDGRWIFGTLQTTTGLGKGVTVLQSVLSTAYVQVPVEAFDGGDPVDPTGDVVEMAFVAVGATPASGDWHTGSWDTAPAGTFLAQCLVGPGTGGVSLTRGTYAVWVRVTDSPERPVAEVGTLQIA